MELCEHFPKRAKQREQKEEKEEKGGMFRGLRKKRGGRAVFRKEVWLHYFRVIEIYKIKFVLVVFIF